MNRRVLTGAALLAVSTLLAGCADEALPQPRPVEVEGAVPVVLDPQVEVIQSNVEQVLATGDEGRDPAALEQRVAGPALELRRAGYTLRESLTELGGQAKLSGEQLTEIAPAADGWPRFFVAAVRPNEDQVPMLQVLTQAGPRDPYKLTAWVTMLPGTTLPETSTEEAPEAIDPKDQAGLVTTPLNVAARYADVLTKGDASEYADAFAEDAFRTQILGEQAAEREAVSEFFSYEVAHTFRESDVWAVRTSDGGAIAFAALDASRTFAVTQQGAKLPLPPDLAAFAGRGEATSNAKVTSLETVAFVIPPEGSDEPITVLAGERGTLAAEAS